MRDLLDYSPSAVTITGLRKMNIKLHCSVEGEVLDFLLENFMVRVAFSRC